MLREPNQLKPATGSHPFEGKKVWFPQMSAGSAQAFAAALRSIGLDAEVLPPSDERTRELGAACTNGDECYPMQVTLGDFMRLLERPDFDASKAVFFMPTAQGPCRFGQYALHIQNALRLAGYPDVAILSPSDKAGYAEMGELASVFVRTAWRALLAGDILLKLLLKTRPYERESGAADAAFEESVADVCRALEVAYPSNGKQMEALKGSLLRARERFRGVAVRKDPDRPLIGIIGEIFCRLNTFSNDELVRRLEQCGGEAWMSDIAEWIWYTNDDLYRSLRLEGRAYSLEMLGAKIRATIQKKDEHELVGLFHEDFRGYEEPEEIADMLQLGLPYLPVYGACGEMVINVARAVYLAHQGVDGVIDISPFTCMNGIVGEAIYPRVSRDHNDIPIRNFYFDGTQSDLERDLGIYLELARAYRKRKRLARAATA